MKPSTGNLPAEQLQRAYLNALARGLRLMPEAKREEALHELASHIEMQVTEAECAGATSLEATQAALQQFGRPTAVGSQIAWEWYKENVLKTPRFAGVLGMIAVVISGAWIMLMYSLMSRVLFPEDQVLITGSEGAKMSIENGVLQVTSGQAGVIGVNSVLLTLALAVPFAIVLGMALVGCASLVRRQSIAS